MKILKDPTNLPALVTKAKCLYNLCKFEHALMFYSRALNLSPRCRKLVKEKENCKKTILNKLTGERVFNFQGSHNFIDSLRSSSNILNNKSYDNEEECRPNEFASAVFLNDPALKCGNKVNKGKGKKRVNDVDPLSLDQEYLRDLEANLMPITGLEKEW